jgi:hypothetical protein
MKRDMDLIRKILFKIEEEVNNTAEFNIDIDGYTLNQIAYHCSILFDGGYITDYKALTADDEIDDFGVGHLTWEGHEFIEKIRSETVWNKTKETVTKKGLPMALDVIKDVATATINGMVQAAILNI